MFCFVVHIAKFEFPNTLNVTNTLYKSRIIYTNTGKHDSKKNFKTTTGIRT